MLLRHSQISTSAAADHGQAETATARAILTVFILTMILPVSFNLAGQRLSPARIMLLLAFIPLLVQLLGGRAGRINAVDVSMTVFCIWQFLSLLVADGLGRFAYAGITLVEILGGYLVGRCLVRNIVDFRLVWKVHLLTLLILFPFVLIDSLTGRELWTEMLDKLGDVVWRDRSSRPRMGFERVITGFEHPILYGLYCSIGFAVGFYAMRAGFMLSVIRTGFVGVMTFLSLSSGALLSVVLQGGLITWGWMSKGMWKLLLGVFLSVTVFLQIASNRGPVVLFIEKFTFSPGNAWTRILQWQYGTAEVMRQPVFGMGLGGDWERPSWLVNSIDNYWLVIAMRHGLPGVALIFLTLVLLVWRITRARDLPPEIDRCRTGYMITLTGLCFTLATVHIWGAVNVFSMFYLGAGIWIAEAAGRKHCSAAPLPAMPALELPYRRSFPTGRPAGIAMRAPAADAAAQPDRTAAERGPGGPYRRAPKTGPGGAHGRSPAAGDPDPPQAGQPSDGSGPGSPYRRHTRPRYRSR